MQIIKLASYTVTTNINQAFGIEINENRLDDDP